MLGNISRYIPLSWSPITFLLEIYLAKNGKCTNNLFCNIFQTKFHHIIQKTKIKLKLVLATIRNSFITKNIVHNLPPTCFPARLHLKICIVAVRYVVSSVHWKKNGEKRNGSLRFQNC